MDRRVFLRGLSWMAPVSDDAWPPTTAVGGTSEVFLRDCSCCFHLEERLCFFATEPGQDATQMPFEMALVKTTLQARHPLLPILPGASSGSSSMEEEAAPQEEVVALFFRIGLDVYLVNHTAIHKCMCPSDPRTVPPEDQAPPYASLTFATVTLRFWMSQLSLSPVKATQPLRDAMEKMNTRLQRRVLDIKAYERRRGEAATEDQERMLHRLEQGAYDGLAAVDDFLSGVETVLQPPSLPWQQEEVNFLLTHSGKLFAKGLAQDISGWEEQLNEIEARLSRQLHEVLDRLFPKYPPPLSQETAQAMLEQVESLSRTLKRVKRTQILCALTVAVPRGVSTPQSPAAAALADAATKA